MDLLRFITVALLFTLASTEDAAPPAGAALPAPTPEQLQLAEIYFNFSMSVGQLCSETLFNESMISNIPPKDHGMIFTSILGLVHVLSLVNEQPLSSPIAVPTFDQLLAATPKKLADAYELILATLDKKESDLVLTSHLYALDEIKSTPALTKLKVEITKSDLKDAGIVDKINTELKNKLTSPMEESYIPKGFTLSPAAKALMIDTLHVTESWPVELKKLEKGKFGADDDMVEMVELKGTFGLVDGPEGVQITIPFQNEKRFLSLVLPNLVAEAPKQLTQPIVSNASEVKIHIPVFKATIRDLGFPGSHNCDFKKQESFLQVLDDLIFVSLDQTKFEAVSISGAQINSVELFKKEMAGKGKPETAPAAAAPMSELPKPAPTTKETAPSPGAEKLLVFNRPFTFTVVDVNLGILMSGAVDSLKKPVPKKALKSTVFGMEQPLAFFNCL